MLPGFLFLLVLTGGKTSSFELPDDQQVNNKTLEEPSGGNSSSLEWQEVPEDEDDWISDRMSGRNIFDVVRGGYLEVVANCSFQNVSNYLGLTQKKDLYTLSRPSSHHQNNTWVLLDVRIYAILDVREIDQTFVSYIWTYTRWDNHHIWWDPQHFCGIDHIIVPTGLLWMPDLSIEEMTEKDKAAPSPFLNIRSHGWVEYRNDQVVVSTCKMHIFKFPFDYQSCNLSIKSILHSDKEIQLLYNTNNTEITAWTREVMRTQYEWLFVSLNVTSTTVNHFGFNQTMIIYTITMKRRSLLYLVNFLLPIFFFMCMDLSSFLLSDQGGEKLSFKVTLLLAITVMQLILNEILPCSSSRIPLIVVYCIGIFALMLLSVLETILMMYLLERDSSFEDSETDEDRSLKVNQGDETGNKFQSCFREVKTCCHCASISVSADQTPSLPKEGSSTPLTDLTVALERVTDELVEIDKSTSQLSSRKKEKKPGYWARRVKWINRVFAGFFITAATLFLYNISSVWLRED